jgi:23S rRNA (cytidine2498-2'-O)-methyltransferase
VSEFPAAPALAPGPLGLDGYLAPEGFEAELTRELGDVAFGLGRLLFAPPRTRDPAWAANVWRAPVVMAAPSIAQAATALRAIQRNWWPYAPVLHRRAALIAAALPKVSAKPLAFPTPAPAAPLGAFTLAAATTLIAASATSSPFPDGEAVFTEDREGPPNRAYLKLWEAFTRLGRYPRPAERVIDLGASPGGWTWVLAKLGTRVLAVDKAPLAPAVAQMPGVELRRESAFGLDPAALGPVDWMCCDIVCYPARLCALLERWIAAGTARNIVATVKFQGETDLAAQARLAAIPGARLAHLHHNKHELTWFWPA